MDSALRIAGYVTVRVLGRGGMGVVYEALRDGTGERVALKVLAPELLSALDFQQRFARELEIAASLSHEHIVEVLGSGIDSEGRAYMAMRYIDGTDLHRRVHERGKLSALEVVDLVEQIAAALDAAHAAGLVHRDVKPANVLLDRSGVAFLADFGLTRHVDATRLTSTGGWLGTPDYVAPEQIQGARVDARADIYALAALTFHALTGSVPFPRENQMAKLWAHVHDPRPVLPADAPADALRLAPVIARGLAADPDERQPSAGDFSRALRAALEGRAETLTERSVAVGDAAPSQTPTTPLRPPGPSSASTAVIERRSRRGLIGGIAIAALLLAVGAAVLFGSGVLDNGRADAEPTATAQTTESPPAETGTEPAAERPNRERRRRPPQPDPSDPRPNDLALAIDSEINVPSQIGDWKPVEDATLAAAIGAFGDAYATDVTLGREFCTVTWLNVGLKVTFANFGGGDPCVPSEGLADTITINGAITDRWRTLSGLRPGMAESKVPEIYPNARKADDGSWWLVIGLSVIGDEHEYPVIAAQIEDRKVGGFTLQVGAAGD